MNRVGIKQRGFTIVELLIVVVVIAILASITIVAYTGIRQSSENSALAASLKQASDKVQLYAVTNNGQYPADLAAAGIKDDKNVTYQYTVDTSGTPSYAITATYGRERSLYSIDGQSQQEGIAPMHNRLVWYKSVANAPTPVSGAVDTSVFRSGDRSIRIGPGVGTNVRGSTFDVTPGQVYTISFWIQTDSNWNGLGNNSKVRFGNGNGGALLSACSYNGVKLTWTYFTCSYTVGSSITRMSTTLTNDGTVGNIWIDDFSLTVQ